MEQGLAFKALYSSLGYSTVEVAKFLHVSPRSVHNWVSGSVMVPVMAVKLLRLHLRYELPGEAWAGWHLSAGRLYTPEGYELNPKDFSWWSLLVRRAALFDVLFKRLSASGQLAGRTAPQARPGCDQRPAGPGALAAPNGEAGRAAQPPGPNSLIGHFRTHETENPANPRLPARSPRLRLVSTISHDENERTHG